MLQGTKRMHETCFIDWWLVKLSEARELDDYELDDMADKIDISTYRSSQPGGSYRHSPVFRQAGKRLLITQMCGLDV